PEPRENIERPTSNIERRSERGFALPFDVRRSMFDVGCSSKFKEKGEGEPNLWLQNIDRRKPGDPFPQPGGRPLRGRLADLKANEPADDDFVAQLFRHATHVLFHGNFGIPFHETLIEQAVALEKLVELALDDLCDCLRRFVLY